eukprot:2358951-Pleurochrysis_carterae.AAC.1
MTDEASELVRRNGSKSLHHMLGSSCLRFECPHMASTHLNPEFLFIRAPNSICHTRPIDEDYQLSLKGTSRDVKAVLRLITRTRRSNAEMARSTGNGKYTEREVQKIEGRERKCQRVKRQRWSWSGSKRAIEQEGRI